MTRLVRLAALHLVLIAMIARALVPAGWMPGQAHLGEAAFVICEADGSFRHGAPGKDDAGAHHQPCAFAAAAKLFDTPDAISVAPPSATALVIASRIAPTAPVLHGAPVRPSPRAPPLSA